METSLEGDDIDGSAGGGQRRARGVRYRNRLAWRCHQGGGKAVGSGVSGGKDVVGRQLAAHLSRRVTAREVQRPRVGGGEVSKHVLEGDRDAKGLIRVDRTRDE